ncbi:hypothetical protein [uncultured Chloroflexus sp.]|uniref:hypothetical protein n=1 Tax=uncultured Chloroflexus sp. TaxID=214040 RepID=UPI00261BCF4A|nr:hypothetical protein [uncultured Chloroflexus sp.]
MRIACLGWGSLIWDPRSLPIQGRWLEDGPLVPVEFARESEDGRVTLVIKTDATPVRVLWTLMLPTELQAAKKALRDRERIPTKNWEKRIGSWRHGEAAPAAIPELPDWAQARNLDAVIWTALNPTFTHVDEIIEHLNNLSGEKKERAEQYIRCAPSQIKTAYRRQIEHIFGWTPRKCGS